MSVQKNEFQSGLFSCEDPKACLYAWICPGCAFASARTNYDSSNWVFNLLTLTPPMARSIIREGYGIEGTCCGDICIPSILTPCAATQLLNEVKKRGKANVSAAGGMEQWKTGLFKFDCMLCCYAYLLPNCFVGQTRRDFDGSNCCFNAMCLGTALLRNIVREGYGIEGNCMSDICISCWCPLCTMVQCNLEIKARGPKKPAGSKMT